MLKNVLPNHRKKLKMLIYAATLILCVAALPYISFFLGNVFFGKIEALYNLRLAHTFFYVASHPVFPFKPPMYAHYQLSRTYFIQGKNNQALDEIREELKIYPKNTQAYYILGLTYGFLGRTHEGIDAFSKYIEASPRTWAGRNDKAWLQFRVGDIDGALVTIEPIVKQFPNTPWIMNTYCALLINSPKIVEAVKVCTHAKEIIDKMEEKDWGHAYPGNDPRIYDDGLAAMRESVNQNLLLAKQKLNAKK